MAKIKNIEGLSWNDIHHEVQNNGAKFVTFQYTISIILMTFRRSSDIYFVRQGESMAGKSVPFTLITLFFGWWGIPWGPIYSIGALVNNLSGGKNITQEVMVSLRQQNAEQ